MKGDKRAIQQLNKVLTNELTAVNQYFLHARMWKNWGFEKLAKHEYEESIGICEQANDHVSRAMVSTILDETEQHIDFLETQIELVGKVGVENYLQSQM